VFRRQPDGSFVKASPQLSYTDGSTFNFQPAEPLQGSADLSTYVLEEWDALLPQDTAIPNQGFHWYVVSGANTATPVVRLLNVDSSGNELPGCSNGGATSYPELGGNTGATLNPFHSVSEDGSKVFFSLRDASLPGGCGRPDTINLMVRIGGQRTVDISEPSPNDECTTAACRSAPVSSGELVGASADGHKAFFDSTQQLTDNATEDPFPTDAASDTSNNGCVIMPTEGVHTGCNLYMYDFSRPAGHELVDLSAGDSSGTGPNVEAPALISDDGSHVYFIARGVLTAQPNGFGQVARAGAENLYVADTVAGKVAFIADLCSGQGLSGSVTGVSQCPSTFSDIWKFDPNNADPLVEPGYRDDATPDGRFLVFGSYGQLTPDDHNQALNVFEYDAQTGSLVRVSVGHDGQDQNGNGGGQDAIVKRGRTPWSKDPQDAAPPYYLPAVSADGQTVVFTTARPLQDGAVNGLTNAYEWHQGEVNLISGGQGGVPSDHVSVSSSGNDIFFTTDQGLVPQDTDGLTDLYDARVGGGFPTPPTPTAPCAGDACQGAPSAVPGLPTAASVTFAGPGSATGGSAAAPWRAAVLTRTVHGSPFLVTVRVPGAGRITISGAGIGTVRRSVAGAGTYAIRVSLTQATRRVLARTHRVGLTLHVGYASPRAAAQTASVRLAVMPALRRGARRARRATNATRRAGK
jgi:hypothetical protein